MKIALIGYGKMGKIVEEIALHMGHVVVCKITSTSQEWHKLEQSDIAIDFSTPESVVDHVTQCALYHKNVVIGTTGWLSALEDVQRVGREAHIGILYAPNFSLGVHLFLKLLQTSGHLFNPFPEYQAAGIEIHHTKKKDAPSGTALAMRDFLKEGMHRQEELPLTSVRLGTITGKHTLLFDSPFDTISISHEAKNKEGYAIGSIKAAEWLMKKEGFYTLADMI